MAWIKMRTDLADDPAVIGIASTLSIEEDLVVGKLHRLWSWADGQTTDGNAPSVTEKWVDRYVRLEGFAKAMEKEHWLKITHDGISFPNFDRHMSQGAKTRALTAERVRKSRGAECNGVSVTPALPDKMRGDKIKDHHDDVSEVRKFLTEKGVDYHAKIGDGLARMNGDKLATVKGMWRQVVNTKLDKRPAAMARAIMDYEPKVTE